MDMTDDPHGGVAAFRAAFRRYLSHNGIRWTRAREKILDAALELNGHFDAEEILSLLEKRGQKVGKATVYRTLPLLVECGILKQVRFEVKQAHYERAIGESPHDHMICERCGRIVEFAADEIVGLCREIARRHHFHAIGHRFQITGLCWECSINCPVAAALRDGRLSPKE